MLDIVKTIDGEEIFTNCIIHGTTCTSIDKNKEQCPLHDDYADLRADLISLFSTITIHELVKKASIKERVNF
jgi:DNA-binding IscR family transcriptional regulator